MDARLVADPALSLMFDGVRISLLRTHQLTFMKTAFTKIPDDFDVANHILRKHMRLFLDKGLNETHFDWLEKEIAYLDPFIIDALLADETRPRITPINDGIFMNLRGVNLGGFDRSNP